MKAVLGGNTAFLLERKINYHLEAEHFPQMALCSNESGSVDLSELLGWDYTIFDNL
jgi:hypothetical protein